MPFASSALDAVNIAELRKFAAKRLPRVVFDYLDGGSDDEVTLRRNCQAFHEFGFRPRHAMDVSKVDSRTTVLGFELSFPAILAPVGYSRLMHRQGSWRRLPPRAKMEQPIFCQRFQGTGWRT